MKNGCLFLCGMLFLGLGVSSYLYGVPAHRGMVSVNQPDGTSIQIALFGDEFYHWHEDEQGFTVLRDKRSGFWHYACRDGSGQLVSSGRMVGKEGPGGIEKHARCERSLQNARVARNERFPKRRRTGERRDTPTTGTIKNLVVLVEFSDLFGKKSRQEFEELFNKSGYNLDGAVGSVKDYYKETSYNQLNLESTVTEWVRLNNNFKYYGENDFFGNDKRPREMVEQALQKLEDSGFDFAPFDTNGDGWIDCITIIHAGHGEEYGNNNPDFIWSHKWQLATVKTYDGVKIQEYHTEPELRGAETGTGITRIGVICHETGHFLGLPDLYDTDYSSEGIGKWGVMAAGSWGFGAGDGRRPTHFCAWSKVQLGWVTPRQVENDAAVSLKPVKSDKEIVEIKHGKFPVGQYLLIENKQKIGFDADIPKAGLCIWRIDDNQAGNDNDKEWKGPGNDVTKHYLVALIQQDGYFHLEKENNQGDAGDVFSTGTLPKDTSGNVNSGYYPDSGTNVGNSEIEVTNISASGSDMAFKVKGQVTVGISDASLVEGNSGTTEMRFPVTLSYTTEEDVRVDYYTQNNSAVAGQDYEAVAGTLTIPSGNNGGEIVVNIFGDLVCENHESFFINLVNPFKCSISRKQGVGAIQNDDPPATLSIGDTSLLEGDAGTSDANFTVSLSNPSEKMVTVQYKTVGNTASIGVDFEAKTGTVTFAPHVTTQVVSVPVKGDLVDELNESFFVDLYSPNNATITDNRGECVIQDDDTSSLGIADAGVMEKHSGTLVMEFTVTLSPSSAQTVTVQYATQDGTAIAGTDYEDASGTLTFPPGTPQKKISVTVLGDTELEPDETFFVNLSSPMNATISDNQGAGTIYNKKVLSSLKIVGETSMSENDSRDLDCEATYDDATTSMVEPEWEMTGNPEYASVSSTGILTTHEVNGNISCEVKATYSDGTVTQTDTHAVDILNDNPLKLIYDFDGDGKSDFSVWKRETGEWYCLRSSDQTVFYKRWGSTGEKDWLPVPGNYDNDKKTDLAVWNIHTGEWYCLQSSDNNNSYLYEILGNTGIKDWLPVPVDLDGDGKTDFCVWNKSTGVWNYKRSSDGQELQFQWKEGGNDLWVPAPGDFDGDGKTDFCVWEKSTGIWHYRQSSNEEERQVQWKEGGENAWIPVPADYDGDKITDMAVWNKSTGEWHCRKSSDIPNPLVRQWRARGTVEWVPVPGDFDGDKKADLSVWEKSRGRWYFLRSSNNNQVYDIQLWGNRGERYWVPLVHFQYVYLSSKAQSSSGRDMAGRRFPGLLGNGEIAREIPGE